VLRHENEASWPGGVSVVVRERSLRSRGGGEQKHRDRETHVRGSDGAMDPEGDRREECGKAVGSANRFGDSTTRVQPQCINGGHVCGAGIGQPA
jgi:hypothetical protein